MKALVFTAPGRLELLDVPEPVVAGGVAVRLGLAENDPGFDANALVRAEKTVHGSFAYSDEEFGRAMRLLAGRDLSWTGNYPLSAGAEIFTELMNGALHPAKALLLPEPL